jgi:hypothetical protein
MKFGDEVEIWKFSAWCLLMHTGNGYVVCTIVWWFFEFCYSLMFKGYEKVQNKITLGSRLFEKFQRIGGFHERTGK